MTQRPGRARRVVFLDNFPRIGGAERNLVDLLARLDRRRFTPTLVTSGEGELADEVRRLDVPVLFCPLGERVSVISRTALGLGPVARAQSQLFGYLARLAKTLRSVRPRLVWSNSLKDHLCSAFLTPVLRKPAVWHLMDFLEKRRLRDLVEAVVLATPTHVVTNSHFTAGQFPRLGRRSDKVRAIYEGLDLAEVDRERKAPPAGALPEGPGPVVAQVGALCPEKGQELLVRALPVLIERMGDVSCWIVGDEIYSTARHRRGYRAHLEDVARSLGVRDRVHFLGWRSDVIRLVERIDIMVSVSDPGLSTETFGRTLVEAMACGKPVVAFARGGPAETVRDGVTGLLFRDYTPRALADAILRLAGEAELMRRMGRAGRARVEQLFTVERYVRDVQAYLGEILGT